MLWAHIGNASDMMGMHGWYYSGSQDGGNGVGKRSIALGIGSASASDSMDVGGTGVLLETDSAAAAKRPNDLGPQSEN